MSQLKIYCTASVVALCAAGFASQVMAADVAQSTGPGVAQLGEVVVTAEKRESSVQKTPLAITAVPAGAIADQHITDVTALNGIVPGVQIYSIVNAVQVEVRGLGSTFVDPRAEGAVASSVDGLYFTKPTSNGGQLYDIARVEVLKGPQGTLYGQNAAAGALSVITNHPVHYTEGALEVGVGNYNLIESRGMINVPVGDTLAFRGAFNTQNSDGYIGHYYGDDDYAGARGEALWTPTDKLTVFAELNYNHQGGHGTTTTYAPYLGIPKWSLQSPVPGLSIPKNGQQDLMTSNAQLQVDYDLGPVTLKSITGYVRQEAKRTNNFGIVFPTSLVNNLTDATEELRLTSNAKADHAGGLQWVAGLYYLNEAEYYSFFTLSPQTYPSVPQQAGALYGQATYAVTDHLRLTGGVRYTVNDKGLQQVSGSRDSITFNNISYKVGAEYDITPRNMVYADVSTGYIAGGLNPGQRGLPTTNLQLPPTFAPEINTAYEIGSKNRFLDNRLQLNVDAYYYDFKNYQLFTVAYPNVGSFSSGVANAGNVTTYGIEADGVFLLTPNDQISGSVALAHGQFNHLSYPAFILNPFLGFPAIRTTVNNAPLINLPNVQFSPEYMHTFELPNNAVIKARIYTTYNSSFPVIAGSYDPNDQQRAYWMSDASATYSMNGGKWELEAWIRNIENVSVNIYGTGTGNYLYQTMAPRTFGLTARMKFGGR